MSTTYARKFRLADNYGLTGLGIISVVASIFVVVVVSLVLALTLGGRAYGRTTCTNWSQETGVRTKFAVLNWLDSGQCLALTPSGTWVLNSRWQAFVEGSK